MSSASSHSPGHQKITVRCLLTCVLVCLFVPIVAQKGQSAHERPVAAAQNRIALHDETPGHCFAFVWWNRLEWDSLWQETYTYSPQGQVIAVLHDAFASGVFIPFERQAIAYSNSGYLSERVTQRWVTGMWTNAVRETWATDAQGNDTLRIAYSWRQIQGQFGWDTTSGDHSIIAYDGSGQITNSETSYWVAGFPRGHWERLSRSEYFFDGLGQWDSLIVSSPSGNAWVPSNRLVQVQWHDYALGQRSGYRTQYYQGSWIDAQRVSCVYQGLGSNCVSESYTNNAWDTTYRESRDFDVEEHLTQWERQEFNNGNWLISNGGKHFYTYNGIGQTEQVIDQSWDPTIGYLNAQKRIYDSFFVSATTPQVSDWAVTAFPNPVTDVLHIQSRTREQVCIKVLDMQGRMRMQATRLFAGECTIPISDLLPNGTYFYQVSSKTGQAQGKFILLR